MRHALSEEALLDLAQTMRGLPLLAFDFDGTLAEIVALPGDARIDPALAAILERLAQRLPVAIVTGRSVGDVAPRLGFEPAYIIGNHGAEDPAGELPSGTLAHLDRLRDRLRASAGSWHSAGVSLEDKRHSLALHYRRAPDREAARRVAEELISDLPEGLRSFGGKCVVNVVPRDAPDKGRAVLALMRRAQADAVVYVGDDVNDEAVFERAQAGWFTVRVGRDDPHSAAMYALDGHGEVAELLSAALQLAVEASGDPTA
ncbi:trehalose-phosphatase [Quisquiliibacterium transsilvanicum]|jgi:trehalose 6-phosphate phosphatase|uniref:Trehalose 6-phosphate phosphatase n=1 Tax=Quisquiliibacterium transsilvanicum TaxID=1549638 RepID=A0A7W8HG78_9BURK|nr:trehalose-phosphatase [Quisquiliibacterium transsilvanicum]MBB5270615.1 trehalose 6-phosphate phosphatase [Quisquiliibacterium transsilvanicum]